MGLVDRIDEAGPMIVGLEIEHGLAELAGDVGPLENEMGPLRAAGQAFSNAEAAIDAVEPCARAIDHEAR